MTLSGPQGPRNGLRSQRQAIGICPDGLPHVSANREAIQTTSIAAQGGPHEAAGRPAAGDASARLKPQPDFQLSMHTERRPMCRRFRSQSQRTRLKAVADQTGGRVIRCYDEPKGSRQGAAEPLLTLETEVARRYFRRASAWQDRDTPLRRPSRWRLHHVPARDVSWQTPNSLARWCSAFTARDQIPLLSVRAVS